MPYVKHQHVKITFDRSGFGKGRSSDFTRRRSRWLDQLPIRHPQSDRTRFQERLLVNTTVATGPT